MSRPHWTRRHTGGVTRSLALIAIVSASWIGLAAQGNVPPERGGQVVSLGMPPVYEGSGGVAAGWFRPGDSSDFVFNAQLGVRRYLGSPIVGIAAVGLEGYVGVRPGTLDGGGRFLFSIPVFHVSVGGDYNVPGADLDLLLRLELPMRRGGIVGDGSQLRIDYLPSRANSITFGLTFPLWGRPMGSTRPVQNAVHLGEFPIRRVGAPGHVDSRLAAALDSVREHARWVTRFVTPFVDRGGAEPAKAYAAATGELTARLTSRSVADEMRDYHAALNRAFALAAAAPGTGGPPDLEKGRAISVAARDVLLEYVILPYDRLLGQRKVNDHLTEFRAPAQTHFARWILHQSGLPDDRLSASLYVFQTLVDVMEDVREAQLQRWEDSRLVWIPLQLALTPDQYDTQAKLDTIIERAGDASFAGGNAFWYVMNESFQLEMNRSVRAAEDYHVLWIHDFRGRNDKGDPDKMAFAHTVDSYLKALTERVRAYDTTGKLPIYMLFLDQHYFEINKSRLFLRVLEHPLTYHLDLPHEFAAWEAQLAAAQDSLRAAVAASRLLQAERSQYGDAWLANRVKVQVNITNPSDFSFQSFQVAGILPVPDNIMRDHRKIAFYDLTDDDPYRGLVMFTGMGIGEHYVGPDWEDRAVLIQGPAAQPVRDAARRLLLQQGIPADQIPWPLRDRPRADDYAARVAAFTAARERELGGPSGRIMQLYNQTGYASKPIDVAKAVLYSLMPDGSVLRIPDSLWQSYLYASLLTGSALRGCTVMIFAPALKSAPSAAAPTMARAHDLFSALVYMRNALAQPIAAAGGRLLVGLYNPRVGVGDVRGRFKQALETLRSTELRALGPPNPAVLAVLDSLDAIFKEVGYQTPDYLSQGDSAQRPKLHLKANLLLSRPAADLLANRPEWGPIASEYVRYIARQAGPIEGRPDARTAAAGFTQAVKGLVAAVNRSRDTATAAHVVAYLTVGSVNMDYRSMVMDGEAMTTMTGWQTLAGLVDFDILQGLTAWIDTQQQLDSLLPPPGGMTRSMANLLRLAL